MNCCSLESDGIFFHPDDSGRIIHVGPTTIKWVSQSTFTQQWRLCETTVIKYPLDVEANMCFCHILCLVTILCSGFMYLLYSYIGCFQQGFFFLSVLKILGELNSGWPSKVVKDFSMMTQRNNNVSICFSLYPFVLYRFSSNSTTTE